MDTIDVLRKVNLLDTDLDMKETLHVLEIYKYYVL